MEETLYTQPPEKQKQLAKTPSSSSSTNGKVILHSDCLSSVANGNATLGAPVARCNRAKPYQGSLLSSFSNKIPDTTSQQKIETPKQGRSSSRANGASRDEDVGSKSVSRPRVHRISRQADGHKIPKASNASPSAYKARAVLSDAVHFLQIVKAAKMCKTAEQRSSWDRSIAVSASSAPAPLPEQFTRDSRVQCKGCTSTDVAVCHSADDAPDRLNAQNISLFSSNLPHSPVTVHLLPCRISFTGPAPVRKYFRPWRLPTPLYTYTSKIRRTQTSAAALAKDAGEMEPESCNREEQHTPINPVKMENNKNTVDTAACAKGLPTLNSKSPPPLSHLYTYSDHETVNRHPGCNPSLSSCGESPVDITDETLKDTSSPQLLEALLHGRLLRGVSLPLKHWNPPLSENQHELPHAELNKDAASPFSEDIEAYIVLRRAVKPDCEAGKKDSCVQTPTSATLAHANMERDPGFVGIAEYVPLARVKELCYWNHDTLPTLLDDVPQALAFMHLARIVHSMSDD